MFLYCRNCSRVTESGKLYHLNPSFFNLADAQPPSIIEPDAYLPEDIVKRIKGNLADIQEKASVEEKRELDDIGVNQLSQMDCARRAIEGGKIGFNPKLHTFTVVGTNQAHVATLFPKESCSCPSKCHCYHILAAQLSIGQSGNSHVKQVNLTQLRRNACSRKEKRSGRKRPRQGDYDVLLALDSAIGI